MNTMTANQTDIEKRTAVTINTKTPVSVETARSYWQLDRDNLAIFIKEYDDDNERRTFANIDEIIRVVNILIKEHKELAKLEESAVSEAHAETIADYLEMADLMDEGVSPRIAYYLTH